jgi:hypothetical protein
MINKTMINKKMIMKTITKKITLAFLLVVSIIGQVSATVYSVNSVATFDSAKLKVKAGDTISWQRGTYSDMSLWLNKSNIVFRAEIPGETIFNGASDLLVPGNDNVIEGFQWVGGRTARPNVIESRGSGNHFTNINIKDYYVDKYVTISDKAKRNTFSYCTFENRTFIGDKNIFQVSMEAGFDNPGYHVISHCQFKNLPGPGNGADYGVEAIRMGSPTGLTKYSSRSIVEYCYFYKCDGDAETISNKSSDNIYRYNTFENNQYSKLVFRHGSNIAAYGNFFIKCDGAIRQKQGQNHYIFNNYVVDCKREAFTLQNYDVDPLDNVIIAHNTIVNGGTIALGGTKEVGRLDAKPKNVVFANNIIVSTSKDLFNDATGTETWLANIVSGNLGISNTNGFIQADPKLVKNSYGFYQLSADSPAIDNAMDFGKTIPSIGGLDGDYDIAFDVIKNMRPGDVLLKDIGAQEYQSGAVVKPHATLANTGPKYLQENILGVHEVFKKNAVIYPNPVKNSFTIESLGEDILGVEIFNLSGALVYKSKSQTSKLTINEKLSAGVYIVRIKGIESSFVIKKLVVE